MNILFKDYILIERSLEEIANYDETDLEDKLETMHELEYKIFKISQSPFNANPKLIKNVVLRFCKIYSDLFEPVSTEFKEYYTMWSNNHPIEDSDDWADMVINSFYESYGDNYIESIVEEGITWGTASIDGDAICKYITDGLSDYDLGEYLRSDIEDGEGWRNYLSQDNETRNSFLRDEAKLSDDQIDNMDGDDFETWMDENDQLENFKDYLISNLNTSDNLDYLNSTDYSNLVNENTVKEAIKQELYPQYMNMFGGIVEGIKEEISDAIERLDNAEERINNEFSNIIFKLEEWQPNINDILELKKIIDGVYKIVSNGMSAISLALSVNHYSGNIIGDQTGITDDFMDDLHKRDTSDWDREISIITKH